MLAQAQRGQLRVTPADELAALDADRATAEARGDVERVEALDRQLDELFATTRERVAADEHERRSQAAATMRFSSGVRRPVQKRPSPAQQMDAVLLRATNRTR